MVLRPWWVLAVWWGAGCLVGGGCLVGAGRQHGCGCGCAGRLPLVGGCCQVGAGAAGLFGGRRVCDWPGWPACRASGTARSPQEVACCLLRRHRLLTPPYRLVGRNSQRSPRVLSSLPGTLTVDHTLHPPTTTCAHLCASLPPSLPPSPLLPPSLSCPSISPLPRPPPGGQLAGYQQQDSHEFLCFTLEMMAAADGVCVWGGGGWGLGGRV